MLPVVKHALCSQRRSRPVLCESPLEDGKRDSIERGADHAWSDHAFIYLAPSALARTSLPGARPHRPIHQPPKEVAAPHACTERGGGAPPREADLLSIRGDGGKGAPLASTAPAFQPSFILTAVYVDVGKQQAGLEAGVQGGGGGRRGRRLRRISGDPFPAPS